MEPIGDAEAYGYSLKDDEEESDAMEDDLDDFKKDLEALEKQLIDSLMMTSLVMVMIMIQLMTAMSNSSPPQILHVCMRLYNIPRFLTSYLLTTYNTATQP